MDTESFEQLYKKHKRYVLSWCRGKVAEKDVEDISQEVWFKVFLYFDSFEHRCEFRTWLTEITKNTIANHYVYLNRPKRKPKDIDRIAQGADIDDPLSIVSAEQEVGKTLLRLSYQKFGRVFLDYSLKYNDYEETSREWCVPVGTVRSRINRAKERYLKLEPSVSYSFCQRREPATISDDLYIGYMNQSKIDTYLR